MILELKLYWKRNVSFTERTRMIRVLMQKKIPISISAEMFKNSSKFCKMRGSAKKLTRLKVLRIDTTWSALMTLKCLYGPRTSGSTRILSADGSKLINDKKRILERWAEHINSVINRPSNICDEAIHRLPQVTINKELYALPSVEEVTKAIK